MERKSQTAEPKYARGTAYHLAVHVSYLFRDLDVFGTAGAKIISKDDGRVVVRGKSQRGKRFRVVIEEIESDG